MEDTTKLEGIFQDVKNSVDRLEGRLGGVEHRVALISEELDSQASRQIVISIPVRLIMIAHLALGVIIAYIILRIVNCILHNGGV